MVYFLFLISVLISSIFYFRTSKRFSIFDMELSDDVRREITGLITEFNQSAKHNIEIIEDRVLESKQMLQSLVEQIEYMKRLKESLEHEIKESHSKIHSLKEDEIKIRASNEKASKQVLEKSSYINSFYKKVDQAQSSPRSIKKSKDKEPTIKLDLNKEDLVKTPPADFSLPLQEEKTLFDLEEQKVTLKEPLLSTPDLKESDLKAESFDIENLVKADLELENEDKIEVTSQAKERERALNPLLVGKNQEMQNVKKEVLRRYANGESVDSIAENLHLTKGEVGFIVKLG
jgi:hypothetical protein